jgi:hypothetical protein
LAEPEVRAEAGSLHQLESENCHIFKKERYDWIGFWDYGEQGADVSGVVVYAAAVLGGSWMRAATAL